MEVESREKKQKKKEDMEVENRGGKKKDMEVENREEKRKRRHGS